MKKILSIMLIMSITILPLTKETYAQNISTATIHTATANTATISVPFLCSLLTRLHVPGNKQLTDFFRNHPISPEGISSFFSNLANRSIICSLFMPLLPLLSSMLFHAQGFMSLLWAYDYLKDKITGENSLFHLPRKTKPVSVKESIRRFNENIGKLKGQEKPKEELKKIIYSIAHSKNKARINKEIYSHGDIIYIIGPSGTGKTFVSEIIAHVLSDCKPFIISASEVDLQNKDSVISQLFNFDDYCCGNGVSIRDSKRLVQYIKNNRNGVVIINEYDKMYSPGLDEILRTIADQGIIFVSGQRIDCRGITFIITSNECEESVTKGNQDEIQTADDGTGSRTKIIHDKSFLTRIKFLLFENLSEQDYIDIASVEYGDNFTNYWRTFAGIDVDMADTFDHVAKGAVARNIGARGIHSIMEGLTKELADFAASNDLSTNGNDENTPLKKVRVSYNEDTNAFTLLSAE